MIESIEYLTTALKEARKKKNLSQRALGLKTGMPQSHISKIENGEIDLQTSSLLEISRALDLDLMLVPKNLVPTFNSLMRGNGNKQIPKYQLDDEEDEDEW